MVLVHKLYSIFLARSDYAQPPTFRRTPWNDLQSISYTKLTALLAYWLSKSFFNLGLVPVGTFQSFHKAMVSSLRPFATEFTIRIRSDIELWRSRPTNTIFRGLMFKHFLSNHINIVLLNWTWPWLIKTSIMCFALIDIFDTLSFCLDTLSWPCN